MSMNGGGGCTGAHHALPQQGAAAAAAAADTNSCINLVVSGTPTTAKKRPAAIDETTAEAKKKQRHHNHHHQGMKRKYEEDESDVEMGCRVNDKMFKCNYWEDPAYARQLQDDGLQHARMAALDNQTERLLTYLETRRLAPAGASDPPINRYCPFDHDYW